MKAIFKNKYVLIALIVVSLLVVSSFAGLLPLGIVDVEGVDTETHNSCQAEFCGYGELIGPNDQKGFIESFFQGVALSESIICHGKIKPTGYYSYGCVTKTWYVISAKYASDGDWEVVSSPDVHSKTIVPVCPDPDEIPPPFFGCADGIYTSPDYYGFRVEGNQYYAIRAEFYATVQDYCHWGGETRLMQRDEAFLMDGWGGLYYHNSVEELHARQTYEVGETVTIDVVTTYGGYTMGGEGQESPHESGVYQQDATWVVTLRDPDGDVVQTEYYGDNKEGEFTFDVTEDMFNTDSNNEYEVTLYNTWYKLGTLNTYTIDVLGNAPSSVTFYGDYQTKVDKKCTVSFDAIPNPLTGNSIQSFRVAVIYGTHRNLMPGNGPDDPLWLVYKTDVIATNNGGHIDFTPTKESYITVFANAQDKDGRTNLYPSCWTLWAYRVAKADPDMIQDYVGYHWYEGGQSSSWMPWDPAGTWDELDSGTQALIVAVAVFVAFLFLGSFLPKNQKIIAIIIGAILAVVAYYWMIGGFGVIPEIPFLSTIKGIFLR